LRRLFISYARENKRDVDQLVEHLGVMGYETWVDFKLRGGQQWWEEILRRISDSDVFIAVLSEAALNSTACRREFDWAEAILRPILPVAVESLPPALPRRFAERQIIDYSQQDQRPMSALMLQGGLSTFGAAPPLPVPLPDPPAAPLSYLTDLIDLITQSEPLDHAQQHVVVQQLSAALESVDPEERRGGKDILERFISRADLYADVDRIISTLRPLAQTSRETIDEVDVLGDRTQSDRDRSTTTVENRGLRTRHEEASEKDLKTPLRTASPRGAGGDQIPRQSNARALDESDRDAELPPREQRINIETDPTSSGSRKVRAALIDTLPFVVIYATSFGVGVGTATNTGIAGVVYRRDQTPIGNAAIGIITVLVALGFTLWNWGYRRSTKGATIGQSALKLGQVRAPANKRGAIGTIGIGKLLLVSLVLGIASVATLLLIRSTIYEEQVCDSHTCYEYGWP